MKDKKLLGKIGEDMACAMLFSEGYSILARNFRSHFGEIDIICEKDDEIYFVEVKTRTSRSFGDPYEAVDDVKKYRMYRTAEYYLMKYGREPKTVFRVIEIMIRETDDSLFS